MQKNIFFKLIFLILLSSCQSNIIRHISAETTAVNPYNVDTEHQIIPQNSNSIILLGDQGMDNQGQAQVALAIADYCKSKLCTSGLLLGDNIYYEKIKLIENNSSPMDQVFTKYYSNLNFNFMVALGNHDYGHHGQEWEKGDIELNFSKNNKQFYLPEKFYYKVTDLAVFVVLDTNLIYWNLEEQIEAQEKMLKEAKQIADSQNKWLIVSGHHQLFSNAGHGNAGDFDRITSKNKLIAKLPLMKNITGYHLKKFFEKNICGSADIYISGHDHSLQMISGLVASEKLKDKNYSSCDTYFLVSGAGAGGEGGVDPNRNPVDFQYFDIGFMNLNISDAKALAQAVDDKNQILFTKEIEKKSKK